ncbi:hypothetical protein [Asticcacaulis sp. YBE204]|uniref:hypothetical protein n=1 Tax=Asticcacaulis sp. YBE204 TaxID=1282363 RepID=UPI0003C3FCDD|nr:hypothetical protein [Asticcacaulis sp. YBE204]ESQ79350.1 hypothetical protein AEYBE204_10095 [Asticcacaulis sp. YBE204]
MTDPITRKSAQQALAEIARAQAIGRRRGVWPRWTKYLEALLIGFALSAMTHSMVWISLAAAVAAVFLRFWSVRHYGALPRWHWTNTLTIVVVAASAFFVALLRSNALLGWFPVALGIAVSLSLIVLFELQRNAALAKRDQGAES